jgi:hypothetical protein
MTHHGTDSVIASPAECMNDGNTDLILTERRALGGVNSRHRSLARPVTSARSSGTTAAPWPAFHDKRHWSVTLEQQEQ